MEATCDSSLVLMFLLKKWSLKARRTHISEWFHILNHLVSEELQRQSASRARWDEHPYKAHLWDKIMAAELCAMSAAMDEWWQECGDGVQTFPIADDWMLGGGGRTSPL